MKSKIEAFMQKYFNESIDINIKILNVFALGGMFICVIYTIIYILEQNIRMPALITSLIGVWALIAFKYANRTGNYERCFLITSILLNLIALPSIFIIAESIDNSIPSFYIFTLILTFMMLRGRQLAYLITIEIGVMWFTYFIKFKQSSLTLNETEQVCKYIYSALGVTLVSVVIGLEFYYQVKLYVKKQQENEKQKIMLEENLNKINLAKLEIEKARAEADSANQAKTLFLANMSHEIRTPMNAILGMSELIMRDEISEEVREKAESIQSASKSLLAIINDILDLSKIESGKMELVEVRYQPSSLFNDVINMIYFRLEEKPIELKIEIDPSLPCELYGDEVRFRQILINLLSNAVKYTHEGAITLKLSWEQKEEEAMIKISVKDTGIGIKPEDLNKLFKSFQRLDVNKNYSLEGTGLGLAICKQLLDLMQGTINVKSDYEVGSEFTICIRQKIINKEPMGNTIYKRVAAKNNYNQFIAPRAKILIVDDNLVNIKVAKGLMATHEFKIDTALSGRACLKMLEDNQYDLIFMDHMMPDLDGIDTIRKIRSEKEKYNQESPIVALTANAISGVKELFMQEGFCDYISKPIDIRKLDKLLLKYLPGDLIERPQREESKDLLNQKALKDSFEEILGNMDRSLIYDLLKTYYKETTRLCRDLESLFVKDIDLFRINVHAIKGSSANLGFNNIAELAATLEKAAKERNIPYIKMKLKMFKAEVYLLLEKIIEYLKEYETSLTEEKKKPAVEVDLEVLKKLKQAFEYLDIGRIEQNINLLKQYTYTEEVEVLLEELIECMDNLDYDIGSEKIKEYLQEQVRL